MNRAASWLALVVMLGLGFEPALCSDGLNLHEFILLFGETDENLTASGLRVAAARGTKVGEGLLAPPSLEFDLRAPYRSWARNYQYEAYQDRTYLGYYEYREESYRMQLGLNQNLPSGGRLSIQGVGRRAQSDFKVGGFPPEITISRETGDREFLMDVGFSLDQPLFGPWDRKDDAGAATLKYGKQRAQYKIDSAETVKRAVNLFFDFMIGLVNEESQRLRLDLAEAEAETAGRRFEAGLVSEIDYLEKRISANDAEIAYQDAVSSMEAVRRKMRSIGYVEDRELVPEDLFSTVPISTIRCLPAISPEVVQAEHDRDLARITLARTERKRYGQSTLSLWYGLEGLGDNFDESRDLFRRNRWGGYLSVHFLFPEPGLGADIELARANLKIAQSAYDDAVRGVEERWDILLKEVRTHQANAELQTTRNRLLENVIEIKSEQYGRNIIDLKDLVEAETGLTETRVDHLETMRRLNLAWVEIALLSGLDPLTTLRGDASRAE
jgi:outer membrane protein TolC